MIKYFMIILFMFVASCGSEPIDRDKETTSDSQSEMESLDSETLEPSDSASESITESVETDGSDIYENFHWTCLICK